MLLIFHFLPIVDNIWLVYFPWVLLSKLHKTRIFNVWWQFVSTCEFILQKYLKKNRIDWQKWPNYCNFFAITSAKDQCRVSIFELSQENLLIITREGSDQQVHVGSWISIFTICMRLLLITDFSSGNHQQLLS